MSCEKLSILATGVEPTEVAVGSNQIRVSSGKDVKGGDFLQATADRVSRSGPEGTVVILEGTAKLLYVRQGKKAEVSAERISVNLATGQVVSDLGNTTPVSPIVPATGSTPCPSAGYPSGGATYYAPPPVTEVPVNRHSASTP
jgi:hypothetical protein